MLFKNVKRQFNEIVNKIYTGNNVVITTQPDLKTSEELLTFVRNLILGEHRTGSGITVTFDNSAIAEFIEREANHGLYQVFTDSTNVTVYHNGVAVVVNKITKRITLESRFGKLVNPTYVDWKNWFSIWYTEPKAVETTRGKYDVDNYDEVFANSLKD